MPSVEEFKSAIAEREATMLSELERGGLVAREFRLGRNQPSEGVISIITGPRRAGKSTYAFQLCAGKNFGYVNFEDERLKVTGTDLNKILEAIYSLKGETDLLVFDEIQNIDGWEKFVTRLASSNRIIITGSNARLMSRELATFLTGRHMDHELYPFSFREYLQYRKCELTGKDMVITRKRAELYNLLNEYIEVGGFPLASKLGKEYLLELYRDVLERDILARYHIRYSAALRDVSKYLISNCSSEISYSKLSKIFGIRGTHTIQNWIEYLRNSYLIFTLDRFSYKLKEQSRAPKKMYSIDTGIVRAIAFRTSADLGKLIENLVAIELLRRKSYLNRGSELYYWKDHSQNEVDFVIKEGQKVTQLIQVTYATSEGNIESRELTSLSKAANELDCNDLLIITWDYTGETRHNGNKIRVMSILNWLFAPTNKSI
jgi:hypothetical protein